MAKRTPCIRCGRLILESNTWCNKCNRQFQTWMRYNPLTIEKINHSDMMSVSLTTTYNEHNERVFEFNKTNSDPIAFKELINRIIVANKL